MKCNDFEASVIDLLKGALEEPELREALAHAHDCKKCEAVLFEQQRLDLELQTLASNEWSGNPPPELEQRLVAAFNAHSNDIKLASRHILLPVSSLKRIISVNKWKYATVAVSLALCIFVSLSLLQRPSASPSKTVANNQKSETIPPLVEIPQAEAPIVESKQIPVVHSVYPRTQPKRSQQVEWVTAEIATNYFAIPYVEPFRPSDRVTVVRIQVPYMMLADYGLPVYSDQALNPVRADVMVGDDNIARAIRFVQQWRLPREQSRPSLRKVSN